MTSPTARAFLCAVALLAPVACATRAAHPAARTQPTPPPLSALKQDLDTILGDPVLAHGTWGVVVKSLVNGEMLYSMNPQKLLMPASNMKIVTLAAAAERLGWDYTYETRLVTDAPVVRGVLEGDLVVVGSGDPSLAIADGSAARTFDAWAAELKRLGIGVISGRIVGNDDAFEDVELGFGWSWDDLPDDYAAGVGALQYNESAVRVTVRPGPAVGDQAAVSVEPPGSGIGVTNAIRTGPAGSTTAIATARLPGRQQLELRGTIAADAAARTLAVSVDNPTSFFVESLRQALIARGIDVRGPAVDGDELASPAPSAGKLLVSHRSPPLSTLAVRLMKASQNQYAETLLKTLSAAPGSAASADGGRAVARTIFESWGLGAAGLIQRDGSGLSRYNYVTAEALVTILTHVHGDQRLRDAFEASLPIAGRDGSLANRMKGTPAEGNARAKTGSMSNVRGLSGFVTSADGEALVFAILANNFETPADTINGAADRIVVRLAQFKR